MLFNKIVTGLDLLRSGETKSLLTKYTYTEAGQLESIITENNKTTYFAYGDSRYPKLVTKVEDQVGDQTSSIKE